MTPANDADRTGTTTTPGEGAEGAGGTAARRARLEAQRAQARKAAPAPASPPADEEPTTAPPAALTKALDPDRLAALEEERDFLLGSLDDLEREHSAGDVDLDDYEVLKDDYTARAAAVLRAIESRNATMQSVRSSGPKGRPWLTALVVVLVALVAGVAVAQGSGRREPGGTASGEIRKTSRERLFEAQQLVGERKLLDAIKVYDEVLAQEPANVEALTYKGWLLRLTSTGTDDAEDRRVLVARALELLDQAVVADPTYADARVFRAIVLDSLDRPEQALADLQAIRPGTIPDYMTTMVSELRTRVEGKVRAAGGTVPGTATTVAPAASTSAPPTAAR